MTPHPALRIAVGGFLHESHSFAPRPTTYADFVQPGGFPGLCRGPAMLPAVRGCANAVAGAIAAAEAAGAVLVPLAWCIANPAGPVQDAAFERIAALICAELSAALDAGPLDGVYLDLHGAALAESFPDAEGELLRRVRRIIGAVPVTASLDPHANLTAQMVEESDALAPYLTYPHVDMRDAGARAMRLLLDRIARGAPYAKAFRQGDFWIPITSQCTLVDPDGGRHGGAHRHPGPHRRSGAGMVLRLPLRRLPRLWPGPGRLRLDPGRRGRRIRHTAGRGPCPGRGVPHGRRAGG